MTEKKPVLICDICKNPPVGEVMFLSKTIYKSGSRVLCVRCRVNGTLEQLSTLPNYNEYSKFAGLSKIVCLVVMGCATNDEDKELREDIQKAEKMFYEKLK